MAWQDDIKALANQRPYFDVSATELGRQSYVLWLDLLGTKSTLASSVPRAINFVMKLHIAILEAKTSSGVHYFPLNDGAFLVHREWSEISTLARAGLRRLAITHALESNPQYRFMVRGAVAHGPVLFGAGLTGENHRLRSDYAADFARRIVLGPPLAQAYEAEAKAPPFGVLIHESAAGVVTPARDNLWRWFEDPSVETCVREGLVETMSRGLASVPYPRAKEHLELFQKMMDP